VKDIQYFGYQENTLMFEGINAQTIKKAEWRRK
jgi:hypothetical protein